MAKRVFKPEARAEIKRIRSGNDASLNSGKKSPASYDAALAAAGGTLPASMFKRARQGKLTKRG